MLGGGQARGVNSGVRGLPCVGDRREGEVERERDRERIVGGGKARLTTDWRRQRKKINKVLYVH